MKGRAPERRGVSGQVVVHDIIFIKDLVKAELECAVGLQIVTGFLDMYPFAYNCYVRAGSGLAK